MDSFEHIEVDPFVEFEPMKSKRPIDSLSAAEKHLLIKEVRARRILWDAEYEGRGNHNLFLSAWREVSASLGKPVWDCRRAWTSLRDSLRYHSKKNDGNYWEFMKDMEFLKGHYLKNNKEKVKSSNRTDPIEASQITASLSLPLEPDLETPELSQYEDETSEKNASEDVLIENLSQYLKNQCNQPQKPLKHSEKYAFIDPLLSKLPDDKVDDLIFDFIVTIRSELKKQAENKK